MKTKRAAMAGLLGALAMSASMFLLRSVGVNVNLEALLGSLVMPQSPWLVGFLLHIAIGCLVALLYASAFEMAMQSAGPLVGAGLGFSHAMFAGLCMSGIPAMNPLGTAGSSAPGAFFSNLHLGPVIFFALHLLYGAVVGLAYGRTVQQAHEYPHNAVNTTGA